MYELLGMHRYEPQICPGISFIEWPQMCTGRAQILPLEKPQLYTGRAQVQTSDKHRYSRQKIADVYLRQQGYKPQEKVADVCFRKQR